jgi:hypothetical protein
MASTYSSRLNLELQTTGELILMVVILPLMKHQRMLILELNQMVTHKTFFQMVAMTGLVLELNHLQQNFTLSVELRRQARLTWTVVTLHGMIHLQMILILDVKQPL